MMDTEGRFLGKKQPKREDHNSECREMEETFISTAKSGTSNDCAGDRRRNLLAQTLTAHLQV
jgi:hypothetical protein